MSLRALVQGPMAGTTIRNAEKLELRGAPALAGRGSFVIVQSEAGDASCHHPNRGEPHLNKLKLEVEDLRVESFDTTTADAAKGTVFGEQRTCYSNCTCPGVPTCDETECAGTCGGCCTVCWDTCDGVSCELYDSCCC